MSMHEAEKLPNATSTEPTLPPACSTAISVMGNPAIEKQAARPRMSQNRNVQMHRLITEANAPYGRMRGPAHDAVRSKLAGLSITCRTTSVSPASSIGTWPALVRAGSRWWDARRGCRILTMKPIFFSRHDEQSVVAMSARSRGLGRRFLDEQAVSSAGGASCAGTPRQHVLGSTCFGTVSGFGHTCERQIVQPAAPRSRRNRRPLPQFKHSGSHR